MLNLSDELERIGKKPYPEFDIPDFDALEEQGIRQFHLLECLNCLGLQDIGSPRYCSFRSVINDMNANSKPNKIGAVLGSG